MKKILLLVALAAVSLAYAEETVVFNIDFEAAEGYTPGSVTGQNQWFQLASWADGPCTIVNDYAKAQSGEQFLQCEYGNNGANQIKNFDISDTYESGIKYVISFYAKCLENSQKGFSVRVQSVGTSGKTYDVEIAECNFSVDGGVSVYVNGDSHSSTGVAGEYQKVSVTVDPADKSVKEIAINDDVKTCENAYYKSVGTEGCNQIPDGVRVYKEGYFDNFTITAVPEPTILGLLALCGLFLRRK